MTEEALRRILNGVSVITTRRGNEINGMTAAWVSRASFDPPLVMVSIGKTRYTHDMITESKVFSVNILGEDQVDLGKYFGTVSGEEKDKFEKIDFENKVTGSPILKNCVAYLDCKVVSSTDAGDHTIFVGKVLKEGINSRKPPLVYDRSKFWG